MVHFARVCRARSWASISDGGWALSVYNSFQGFGLCSESCCLAEIGAAASVGSLNRQIDEFLMAVLLAIADSAESRAEEWPIALLQSIDTVHEFIEWVEVRSSF